MAKRTKKLSRPQLKLEALEQRQLLAGVTGGGTEVGSNINHSNGNVYDQVLMTGSSVTVTADAGQVTRVSFLDLQGDIVQAEFSGKGSLTISLDQFTKDVAPAQYNQAGVKYSQGLASFTVSGSDSSTNFAVFSVGKGNAVNQALFDTTHQGGDHTADIARLTIVADPANPNGSDFGAIYAGNAKFSADSGVVGITASNVQVQNAVRIGDVDAKTSATPTLVFGTHSQFAAIDVGGGDLISSNGKSVNNNGSYEYGVNLLAGTDSNGTTLPAQVATPPFTAHDPFAGTAAKTLSLTSGNDSGSLFVGTSSDDTYIASIGSDGIPNNGTTLNPGDVLNGGGGNDTLSISISGTNTADQTTASFTANNIEWLSIANYETSAKNSTIDLAGMPQLKAVTINASSDTGDTALTSVPAIVGLTLKSNAGDLNVSYAAAAVAGTADVQSLTLSAVTGGTVTVGGVETVAITSNTADNTITLAAADATAITVAGDKGLTLSGNLSSKVTSVNGSALTAGSLTVTGNDANDYNIVGGAGNDSITISAGFGSGDSVDGGAGTDTLSIAATINDGALKNVSNVEVLKVTGGNTITLAKNVGPTTFDLSSGTNSLVLGTLASPGTYTNPTTVNLTGNGAGGSDIDDSLANVALTVNTKDVDQSAGNSLVAGSATTDTLNIKASGGTADITGVRNFETINVTGGDATTITYGNAVTASGKTLTIDGSTKSGGALTINASTESDGTLAIKGGAGDDVLTGGSKGSDSIWGGAGKDTITLATVKSTNLVDGGADADVLSTSNDITAATALGGVTNVETLKLTGTAALTLAAPITATTGIANLDLSAGTHAVTLNSGFTDALTVKLTGKGSVGTSIIDGGTGKANAPLTINAGISDLDSGTAVTTITAGTGTDVLTLTADNAAKTADLSATAGIDSIVILPNSSVPATTASVTMSGASNAGVAFGKTLTVDASALIDSGAALTFVGDSSETDGFIKVIGGAGNDAITTGASGFDTVLAGAGDDTITLPGAVQATHVIDGGAGKDTLVVNASTASSSSLLGVTNVETLKLSGAGTTFGYTTNFKASTGIATVDMSAISAQTLTIGAGVTDAVAVTLSGDTNHGDTVTNSANTTLTVSANAADITSGVTLAGGSGTDTLNLKADASATTNLSWVTGFETVNVAKGSVAAQAATITVGNDRVVAAGKTLTIDASGADGVITFDGTAELDGSLVLKGGSGADVFKGGSQSDTFTGGGGADTFNLVAHANKSLVDVVTDASKSDHDIINTPDVGTEVSLHNSPAGKLNAAINLGGSGLASFSDYLDAAAASGSGAHTAMANGVYSWFVYNGNTYIVMDVNNDTTFQANSDMVIQLNGVLDLSNATVGDHTITLG